MSETPTPRCYACEKPATCIGCYEGPGPIQFCCDDCCGHGCEDGWCVFLGGANRAESILLPNIITKVNGVIERLQEDAAEARASRPMTGEVEAANALLKKIREAIDDVVEGSGDSDVPEGQQLKEEDFNDPEAWNTYEFLLGLEELAVKAVAAPPPVQGAGEPLGITAMREMGIADLQRRFGLHFAAAYELRNFLASLSPNTKEPT